MHAIKAFYDDLKFQRTQLYGNIWYDRQLSKNIPFYLETNYENLDYENIVKKSFKNSLEQKRVEKIKNYLINPFKLLKRVKAIKVFKTLLKVIRVIFSLYLEI